VLEIRGRAFSSLTGSPTGLPGGMPTFSSSLTYPNGAAVRRTRRSPFLPDAPPFHLCISSFYLPIYARRDCSPPPALSSEARCLDSVLLFPFQLNALANLCPRPLLYSIFRFPAFIESDTLAGSLERSSDRGNDRALRRDGK